MASLDSSMERILLTAEFDALSTELATLQKYVADSTHFLPSFDLRQAQEKLKEMQATLLAQRESLLPKKKFAFKSSKPSGGSASGSAPTLATTTSAATAATAATATSTAAGLTAPDSKQLHFKGRQQEVIRVAHDEAEGKDIALEDLVDCQIFIPSSPDALHVRNLKGCTICIGPVRRSLLLHDCVDCRFVLACQQLRIHNTTKTDFYIHVTSRAIIENCTEVRFAPYNWTYEQLDADFATSGLDRQINHWDQVNDFLWIKPSQPSPNWSVLPEPERIQAWTIPPSS